VMLMSMMAWVLRFGFFGFGNPEGLGLALIILSCIVYGMAFDFFNISGSLFVETSTDSKMRSSAQGLFMMMTNGFGAVFGSLLSGWVIDKFFTHSFTEATSLASHLDTTTNDSGFLKFLKGQGAQILDSNLLSKPIELRDWHDIWISFALYALVITVLFAIFFKHKHNPEEVANIHH